MISSKNVVNDSITHLDEVRHLSKADFELSNARTQVSKGDVLFTSVASLGRTCIYDLDYPITFQRSVTIICTRIFNRYLKLFLDSPVYQNYVGENARGTAQKGFYINQISDSLVPIPPLNEQIRIVEKAQSLLDVVQVIDYSKEETSNNILALKSKILDLAISGKLVRQDKSDEPAIELLRKINPSFKPCDNRHYENLPDSWEICRLKDIFNITMGQSPDGETINSTSGIEFHQGKINFTDIYISESGIFTTAPTKIALPDSLLLCVRAPVGVVNITKRKICIGRGLCSLHPKYDIDCLFWLYVLGHYKHYFEENATGTTFKAISGDVIKNLVIPFPPIAEQNRILAKINELYQTLDRIAVEL